MVEWNDLDEIARPRFTLRQIRFHCAVTEDFHEGRHTMGRAEHGTIAIVAVLALGFTLFGQSSGVGGPPSNRTGGRGGENPGVRPQNTLPYGVSETSRGVFRIKDTRPLE